MNILKQKTAIITGAAQGIGKAIAMRFSKEGAVVVLLDTNKKKLDLTLSEIGSNAYGFQVDITNEKDVEKIINNVENSYGFIDILVNNAATSSKKEKITKISLKEWEKVLGVNINGTFIVTKSVLPGMISNGSGIIINIASQLGSVATRNSSPYCTSKGAIIQFTKALALDHALDGIRVNSLSPGAVLTQRLIDIYGSEEKVNDQLLSKHPIGRIANTSEIAAAAVFLASPESSFVTGSDLLVDGGYLCQ